ncbi:hypothetical protein B4O97_06260 [Marispirochaeta aestuarii]|uniref:DUF3795 domain-containing protein n=1 Tax=Marispirochaeta aestuarii TaxID=1963862 RepID=A0A1Y1S0J5_9SPIO|nr:DUF3795 domain-containing protein [Marispirochaeta aestuarii]ORC36190.1 hypothetical protein B4O97_06260 [Marispirochaeta aestuarii]
MKEYSRKYPEFSLCGLNCVLCPRFQTEGSSRCPGCGGSNFHEKHPACSVITCSRKHDNTEFCHECAGFPCERYAIPVEKDSFITKRNVFSDMEKAKRNLSEYLDDLKEKQMILEKLIADFNDGRMKSFYCLAVNLLPLKELKSIVGDVENAGRKLREKKEKARTAKEVFLKSASSRGIALELRK